MKSKKHEAKISYNIRLETVIEKKRLFWTSRKVESVPIPVPSDVWYDTPGFIKDSKKKLKEEREKKGST